MEGKEHMIFIFLFICNKVPDFDTLAGGVVKPGLALQNFSHMVTLLARSAQLIFFSNFFQNGLFLCKVNKEDSCLYSLLLVLFTISSLVLLFMFHCESFLD